MERAGPPPDAPPPDAPPSADAGAARADRSTPRVVTLLPAASSLLVAIGAEHQVVARATDDPTPELADRADVGYLLRPSLEAILEARPDVVVAWAGADLRALRRALAGSATVLPLSLDRLRELPHAVRTLAAAVGRPGRGVGLADSLEARLRAVEALTPTGPRIRALWVVSSTPPVAAGPGTLPDDLLRVAGASNVLESAAAPWPTPSTEQLLSLDPDVIVWPVGGGLPPFDRLPTGAPWRVLSAARQGRTIQIEADLVHELGPRVAEAAERLHELLRAHVSTERDDPRP